MKNLHWVTSFDEGSLLIAIMSSGTKTASSLKQTYDILITVQYLIILYAPQLNQSPVEGHLSFCY